MLNKENRLTKNKHFTFIYKHGESKQIGCVSLVFVKTKFQPYKVGFSVSNKIGKSHIRNKVKRRLREAFRSLQPLINKNYNYVFVARVGIDKMTFSEIKDNLIKLLIRAKLIDEQNI